MANRQAALRLARYAGAALGHLLYKLGSGSRAADYYGDLFREGRAGEAASLMRML